MKANNTNSTPTHVAVIMDGNGRWAKQNKLPRIEGHRRGAKTVKEIVQVSRELGVKYLTLFSFSTENWNRSEKEVDGLMNLFRHSLKNETSQLAKNGIKLRLIGDRQRLPADLIDLVASSEEETEVCDGMELILALSYGGREEIVDACRNIAEKAKQGVLNPDEIDAQLVASNLWTADIPDPDLLIRTSGEMRISNFLLWQLAYSEIVVTEKFWPEFGKEDFKLCLEEYLGRERRFGLTSEQLVKNA